jgi:hypothetical protein
MKDNWKRKLAKKMILYTRSSAIIRRLYPFAISVSFGDEIRSNIDLVRHFLRVSQYESLQLFRVGDNFDGGYVLDSSLSKDLCCLSIGAGTNISFDIGISNFVDTVHLYDHTIPELPTALEVDANIQFFKNGLGTIQDNEFVTLRDCIDKFPINTQLILKVDIEGDEWKVFSSVDPNLLTRCQQIVVEFHGLLELRNELFFKTMIKALENLAISHRPVNVHPNNWGRVELISGVVVPDVLEVTYVRKDLLGNKIPDKVVSRPNFPCNPLGNEIELIFS